MENSTHFDFLVVGNGPVGKIAALLLSKAGFSIALVAPKATSEDQRTTALMMPAIDTLIELSVWEHIASNAAPLRVMRILDDTKNLVRAKPVTFHASDINLEAFGWNMPNGSLNAALNTAVNANAAIVCFEAMVDSYVLERDQAQVKLDDGREIKARVVVGADGRHSKARAACGVKLNDWNYQQTAFVTTFTHTYPHENISTEFHTPQGPCVQVPLPGNRSSLVWVVTPAQAQELMMLDDDQLSLAIERQLHSILGKVSVGPQRQTYPLSGQYPVKFAQNRIVLVGEAAHVFPPIGAQGLNLGIRDVLDWCALASANREDPGAAHVLQAYDQKRRPDILARIGAVDALNRSLLSMHLPAQIIRAFGLEILDASPPLRNLFMREGMRYGAGREALFSDFKQLFTRSVT